MLKFTKITISTLVSASLFLSNFSYLKSQEINKNTLPTGGTVESGNATITSNQSNLSVKQNSDKVILNWETFNIGRDASVEFFQPSSSSTALNRVFASDPSHIYGSLKANGKLIFLNPSGVIFQGGSKVDVGAMIASSLNMSSENFLKDDYVFEKTNDISGLIKNEGTLSAFKEGTIALISNRIENNGVINTPEGSAAMLSGDKVKLSLDGNKLINYSIEQGALNSLIENNKAINANNGSVILSSEGKDDVLSAVINNKGTIKAQGITKKGGKIFLSSKKGKIKNSGTMIASSEVSFGGKIEITGDHIKLKTGSVINVTGKTGGGQALVGGSWQNSNPDVYQAKTVVVEDNTKIDASSIKYGIGGEIVVWSDIHNKSGKTSVKGALLAKGGLEGGDGGRIETSGYKLNINNSRVSTKSFSGKDGDWLLDPYNIEITGSGSSDYTANEDDEEISASTLVSALASSNITVRTDGGGSQDGNITVSSAISSSSSNDLTLQSNNDIFINANITRSGSGGLVLTPGSGSVSGSGTISLGGGSSISSSSGATVENNISLASGDATFNQSGTAEYSGVISGSGNFIKSGLGTVT
ncbi:MAG: hypothetical protein CMJ08_03625, partial [Pelagibacterales bacterium]|nr:hypothetical protein [Pelagibacterales bacterium]